MMNINLIKSIAKNLDILAIYPYGSQVYGTYEEGVSDLDYFIITRLKEIPGDHIIEHDNISLSIYSKEGFQEKLINHDIDAIEAYYTTPLLNQGVNFAFNLDLQKLRHSISAKSSNSFVKAKKKITLENEDSHIGLKSLFHSLRIVMFGIQLARYGKIVDFKEATPLWKDLKEHDVDWNILKDEFKPILNSLLTDFRTYAPKEITK